VWSTGHRFTDHLSLKDAAIVPSELSLPQLSLAKDKIKVLLLEGVNDSAVQLIEAAGYSNTTRLSKALEGDALKEAIKGVHLLGIRSRTQITPDVLEAADRLIAIGCFSVGTNQVDIDAARRSGIPVFNAPFSNTRSVAELVIGEIVILLRRIVARSNAAHRGQWDKSANDSYEVRGKTLGIIGYGNIARSFRILPKPWECGSFSTTIRTSFAMATPSQPRLCMSCWRKAMS
jgi:D-3-phosphoglycerate dehydrogenase / 2-oxoglutarate reductase